MKILCKVDGSTKNFKKMPEVTKADRKKIQDNILAGWEYCDRSTWKREFRDKDKQDEK